jgi:hypothetical protein
MWPAGGRRAPGARPTNTRIPFFKKKTKTHLNETFLEQGTCILLIDFGE